MRVMILIFMMTAHFVGGLIVTKNLFDRRRRIILARHGETIWNKERRFQGRTDIPLNDIGIAQAEALAERLSSCRIDAVYSSPLQRALRTAEAVAARHGLKAEVVPELCEIFFASWEGMSIQGLRDESTEDFRRWQRDPFFNHPEGAETWEQLSSRIGTAVDRILASPHDDIVIVSHGGIMKALYAVMVGLDPHTAWNLEVRNCAISGIEYHDNKVWLKFSNDDMHIRGGEAGRSMPVW